MESASSAQAAVFVKSQGAEEAIANAAKVRGPTLSCSAADVMAMMPNVGFQGTNFGKAASAMALLVKDRTVGTSVLEDLRAYEASLVAAGGSSEEAVAEAVAERKKLLPPVTFLGMISTLFGTGVRDSVAFLCRHALIDVLVVSGGSMEHDIRRACGVPYNTVPSNNSQPGGGASPSTSSAAAVNDANGNAQNHGGRFGNIVYGKHEARFEAVMTAIARQITAECEAKRGEQLATDVELLKTASAPHERGILDGLVPQWILTPSEFWARVGELLPEHLSAAECESSVVYWASKNNIQIFSPSITDGDVMRYINASATSSNKVETVADADGVLPWPARFGGNCGTPSSSFSPSSSSQPFRLQFDLVKDIYLLNRIAIKAHHTGMIICGGGVVKHHICNANLFRNGAEHAVFINNAQEFDGSDGGARPDEAVSWGKIRATAKPVKVYSEISLAFPLLVAATYAEHVFASSNAANAAAL